MAKINFGRQHDRSESNVTILTTGDSSTEINFNDILDQSKQSVAIDDTSNQEEILSEFKIIKKEMMKNEDEYRKEIDAIKNAEIAIEKKDEKSMAYWLSIAGKKTLEISTKIGVDVITKLLTNSLMKNF